MMQKFWYFFAFILCFTFAAGAGVAGALVSTWALRSRLLGLESAVETIHASLTSEIKRRAAFSRPKKDELDELTEKLKAEPQNSADPWWLKFQKQGGS